MSLTNPEIRHKRVEEMQVAKRRIHAKSRKEIWETLLDVKGHLPDGTIAGPGFCIIQFVTSVREGYDAEVGFPVTRAVDAEEVKTRTLRAVDVLSLVHRGRQPV